MVAVKAQLSGTFHVGLAWSYGVSHVLFCQYAMEVAFPFSPVGWF